MEGGGGYLREDVFFFFWFFFELVVWGWDGIDFYKGIITSTARQHNYPLPLLSTAEQLYLTALSAGWGPEDDCVLVRLYLPSQPDLVATRAGISASPSPSSSSASPQPTISLETIETIMVAVHLAAMAEAMAFCELLGVDVDLMFEIVSNAAGCSAVFGKYFGEMRGRGWRLRGAVVVEVGERLVSFNPFLLAFFRFFLGVSGFSFSVVGRFSYAWI